jgi:large subunit ribosomal protein L30
MSKESKPARTAESSKPGRKIKVTLVKGLTATKHKHREAVKGLGLKRREHTVEVADTPAMRGMINRVSYLVKVEE